MTMVLRITIILVLYYDDHMFLRALSGQAQGKLVFDAYDRTYDHTPKFMVQMQKPLCSTREHFLFSRA